MTDPMIGKIFFDNRRQREFKVEDESDEGHYVLRDIRDYSICIAKKKGVQQSIRLKLKNRKSV
jgi:hypothetical protein